MTTGIPDLPGLADLSPLGRGGLADVYLARQIHLERWVAAKVFRVTLDDEQAADRFRAECRALGRIDQYPNIITVYDAGVLPDGRPYLISERCDGSLADLVSVRGPLPAERVAELGLTVARALGHAHAAGVLHGDVTPQNVLLRSSGAPVLADFGLAVLRDQRTATAAGFTQAHAAPETLGDTHAIDERSDVYGLGSTLYAALTGRAPFPREPGEDDPEHVDRIRTEPVPEPDGPPQLTGLLLAMLSKDPARRPGTDEVVENLGALVADDTTQAMRLPGTSTAGWSGPGDAVAQTAHIGGPAEQTRLQHGPQRTTATTARPRQARRRRGLLAGVLAGLLVLAGGAAAAALWQASRDTPAAAPGPAPPTSARPAPAAPPPTTARTTETAPTTSARTSVPRRTQTRAPVTPAPDRDEPRSSAPATPAPTRPSSTGSASPSPGQQGTGSSVAAEPDPADPGADSGAGQRGPSGGGNQLRSEPTAGAVPEAGRRNAPAAAPPPAGADGAPETAPPADGTP